MVDATMLDIRVDPHRLFYGDDPYFEVWLSQVIDRVIDAKRQQEAQAKAKTRG